MRDNEPTILIKITFWLHFLFALASHIVLPFMILGTAKLMMGLGDIGFLERFVLVGASFFSLTYLVNHITNKSSFCCLTVLENVLRDYEGMDRKGAFVPRFWKKCKQILDGNFSEIP